jgi:hypothetical protein
MISLKVGGIISAEASHSMSSKNALLAYVASGFQRTRMTSGTYHIFCAAYGDSEERILLLIRQPGIITLVWELRLGLLPIHSSAIGDDIRPTSFTDTDANSQVIVLQVFLRSELDF